MAILQVQNLIKKFGPHTVLKNINFTLDEGETLAIIGSSGGGKTTLLRCLNFLEKINKGRILLKDKVLFDAEDINKNSEQDIRMKRLHFGLVFQAFHLFPQYTALKNITLARELLAKGQENYKQNKREIFSEIRSDGLELLEQVGLSEKVDFYPYQLSGGQQQRVAIARALALKPDILCFDEPTSALDPELTDEVLKVIRGLAEKKTTMIIVTHEMRFAHKVADKILFIDDGEVVQYGTPKDIFENSENERTKRFLESYSV